MSGERVCRRYFISGRVQGVCYRLGVQQQALALQLQGWVRNRHDGRVEVLACGSAAQQQVLKNWLEIGPRQAKVSTIEVHEAESSSSNSFEIRPTL